MKIWCDPCGQEHEQRTKDGVSVVESRVLKELEVIREAVVLKEAAFRLNKDHSLSITCAHGALTLALTLDNDRMVAVARRAPVKGSNGWDGPYSKNSGTVAWQEHEEAWRAYAAKKHHNMSAERIVELGGFGYNELCGLLDRQPTTWKPLL